MYLSLSKCLELFRWGGMKLDVFITFLECLEPFRWGGMKLYVFITFQVFRAFWMGWDET